MNELLTKLVTRSRWWGRRKVD